MFFFGFIAGFGVAVAFGTVTLLTLAYLGAVSTEMHEDRAIADIVRRPGEPPRT